VRNEYDFQKEVLAYLNANHIWHYRTQMGTQSGLPDIIACYRGFFVGLELKREDKKGRPTEQQLKVNKDLKESGATAEFIDNMEDLIRLFEGLDDLLIVDMGMQHDNPVH
jgi:hypothetical protein